MTLRQGSPWLVSLAVHLAVAGAALAFFASAPAGGPPAIRMRLVATGGGHAAPGVPVSASGGGVARQEAQGPAEPSAPAWNDLPRTSGATSSAPVVPVSLEDLLAGVPSADPRPAEEVGDAGGWRSPGGEGYQVPPLPPPRLAPPQGASWTLVLTIPGTGGYPIEVEGLDSGHPDLDRWLETNLRTISFPAGLDGKDYRLRWVLNLESGRPR